MNNTSAYKNYFAGLAQAFGLDFQYGGSDRILERQSANMKYPVLWVGIPDWKLLRSGGLKRSWKGWFVVLCAATATDWDEQDAATDLSLEKTEAMLQQMQEDAEAGLFEFDMAIAESWHKAQWSADADWGWFTEFEIIAGAKEFSDCP